MTDAVANVGANEINETGYDILRAAVRIARDGNVRKIHELRNSLAEIYPNEKIQIDLAILTWAKYAQEHRHNGD